MRIHQHHRLLMEYRSQLHCTMKSTSTHTCALQHIHTLHLVYIFVPALFTHLPLTVHLYFINITEVTAYHILLHTSHFIYHTCILLHTSLITHYTSTAYHLHILLFIYLCIIVYHCTYTHTTLLAHFTFIHVSLVIVHRSTVILSSSKVCVCIIACIIS